MSGKYITESKNDVRLIVIVVIEFLVGLLVRFSSILTTHGMTVAVAVAMEGKVRDLWREGGRRFTDLGRY